MDKVSLLSRWLAFIGWGILTFEHLSSVLTVSRYVAAAFFINLPYCHAVFCKLQCPVCFCMCQTELWVMESSHSQMMGDWAVSGWAPGALVWLIFIYKIANKKTWTVGWCPWHAFLCPAGLRGLGRTAFTMPSGYWSAGPGAWKFLLLPSLVGWNRKVGGMRGDSIWRKTKDVRQVGLNQTILT